MPPPSGQKPPENRAISLVDERQSSLVHTIVGTDNLMFTQEAGMGLVLRKALPREGEVYVARVEKGEEQVRRGKMSRDETIGTIWPSANIESPENVHGYRESFDASIAWGKTPDEARARLPIASARDRNKRNRPLAIHCGSRENARITFPSDMSDEGVVQKYIQDLTQGLAYMALIAPKEASLRAIVDCEGVIPPIIYATFHVALDILYGQVRTLMDTVQLLMKAAPFEDLGNTTIRPILESVRGLVQSFVLENKDALEVIHRVALDEDSARLATAVADSMGFGRLRR